jgi:hypothetical protein
MEIVYSILLVAGSFALFAFFSYFLVKATFPKIENDDWEERYVQLKKDTERFNQLRSRTHGRKIAH